MKSHSISVVMACYAGDKIHAVKAAVDSVLAQSVSFEEFIIVLDGPVLSEVSEYLSDLEYSESKVKLVYLPKNSGVAVARNTGMSLSKGDYIAIMDSDDILLPQRLEKQLEAIVKNQVDAVWGLQSEFVDGSGNSAGEKLCPEYHDEIIKALKFRCLLSDPTTFIRRECFLETGGYGDLRFIGMDHMFFLNLYLNGFKFYCVQEVLINVRVSPEQRKRRGGFKLLKTDFALRKWMLKKRIITMIQFLMQLSLYTVFRLIPNFFRDLIYKKFLRK
jgi:glycosyltransferase involved in cell wall biosynthesis